MSKVDIAAEVVIRFLKENLNEQYTFGELLTGTGLRNSSTARKAIMRARVLAAAEDLFMPDAVPANGFRYTLTDDPKLVLDPAAHATARALGSQRRAEQHDDFMASRRRGLSRSERMIVDARREWEESRRAADRSMATMTAAFIEMRREARTAAADGQ